MWLPGRVDARAQHYPDPGQAHAITRLVEDVWINTDAAKDTDRIRAETPQYFRSAAQRTDFGFAKRFA